MNDLTTLDAATARAIIAAHGGSHAFRAAWVLGRLAPDVRDDFRDAADDLGIRELVDTLDAPDARPRLTRLIDAANCLAEGQRGEGTQVAFLGEPSTIGDAFRRALVPILEGVGLEPPAGDEPRECAAMLQAIAGTDAVAHFRDLGRAVADLRERQPSPVERLAVTDFPELIDPEYSISFRAFAVRRLIETATERRWQGADTVSLRWSDADTRRLADALGSTLAQPELAADPHAGTAVTNRTQVGPDAISRLIHEPTQWLAVRERLRRFPVLGEVLAWLGLERILEDEWADRVCERVRLGYVGGFRELLRETLETFAAPPRWPEADQWRMLVERAAVRAALRPPQREADWMRAYREAVLADESLDLDRLVATGMPADRTAPPTAFDEYKGTLIALTESRVAEAWGVWEG